MAEKIKIGVTGVGNRALPKSPASSNWIGWIGLIDESPIFELAALHDPVDNSLQRAIEAGIATSDICFTDLQTMMQTADLDALLVSSPAEYHSDAIEAAIENQLHLLVEKPFVTDVTEGDALVKRLETKGIIACVIQNWRYKTVGRAMAKAISRGDIGRVGHIFFQYVRNRENPNYPDYIFQEAFPLLYAMGIHHFDLFRYVLGEEIVSVRGHSLKPPWSLYQSWTGHQLSFRTASGTTIEYTGTISSKNSGLPQETFLIEGEKGSLFNQSDWSDPPLRLHPDGQKDTLELVAHTEDNVVKDQYDASDRYILERFGATLLEGREPLCPARDGLQSVKVVEAARRACETGQEIAVPPLA